MRRSPIQGWTDEDLREIVDTGNYVSEYLSSLGERFWHARFFVEQELDFFRQALEARKRKVGGQ
jgi:hypothetical protein